MLTRHRALVALDGIGLLLLLALLVTVVLSRSPAAPPPLPPGACAGVLVASFVEPPKGPEIADLRVYADGDAVCARLDKRRTTSAYYGIATALSVTMCTGDDRCSQDEGPYSLYAGPVQLRAVGDCVRLRAWASDPDGEILFDDNRPQYCTSEGD